MESAAIVGRVNQKAAWTLPSYSEGVFTAWYQPAIKAEIQIQISSESLSRPVVSHQLLFPRFPVSIVNCYLLTSHATLLEQIALRQCKSTLGKMQYFTLTVPTHNKPVRQCRIELRKMYYL